MDSIFLGVIFSISPPPYSEDLDELGAKSKNLLESLLDFIVQDIVAILMMVLLSTVAVSQQFS
jgi:CPA2 family monovalent cation:H+ antiporter-2